MPGRQNPTLRQRRLGAELRKMREQSGLGGSQLARALGVSAAQVTQMENGKTSVNVDRLRSFAAACKCINPPLIEALEAMVRDRSKGWWEKHRGAVPDGVLENAEFEKTSRELMLWLLTHMPGPCQTFNYASAVFGRVFPPLPQHELEARTAFRMQRKAELRRSPKPLTFFIYESVLWTRFGGTAVLKEQLSSLLEDSELPWMTIRVVPFDIETFPGPAENLTYSFGAVPELDTVERESSHGPEYLDAVSELASYRAIFERTEASALSEDDSRDLIRKIARNL
ncbi:MULTISPECIES: helix-turn-helix transcriptional regulator [Streptomycetaceae]|uniref:helix-turn-helix domain-containing protein n=1 Tax=Streptomycetaceae TaxID=2062 RepID=UPI000938BA0D|nr:helix-turn-helix transcriptional regulator [Streptomyces sp. CB02056]